jgi:hypothetical protein
MTKHAFPELDPVAIAATRDALQAYALVVGNYPASLRARRKHWWHISLRPSLEGMTTGVIRSKPRGSQATDFELVIDPAGSQVKLRSANGEALDEALRGQPTSELAHSINAFLAHNGVAPASLPAHEADNETSTAGYSAEVAAQLGAAWRAISTAKESFKAGIPEETSPVMLWPHHFDLAMMWLPGEKIPGQDPADEEQSDKQMNFGFTFGDGGIAEPYFYITAYPLPEAFPGLTLPAGTRWHTEGFSGAVLLYRDLLNSADPEAYLLDLWNTLLSAGREHMLGKGA